MREHAKAVHLCQAMLKQRGLAKSATTPGIPGGGHFMNLTAPIPGAPGVSAAVAGQALSNVPAASPSAGMGARLASSWSSAKGKYKHPKTMLAGGLAAAVAAGYAGRPAVNQIWGAGLPDAEHTTTSPATAGELREYRHGRESNPATAPLNRDYGKPPTFKGWMDVLGDYLAPGMDRGGRNNVIAGAGGGVGGGMAGALGATLFGGDPIIGGLAGVPTGALVSALSSYLMRGDAGNKVNELGINPQLLSMLLGIAAAGGVGGMVSR